MDSRRIRCEQALVRIPPQAWNGRLAGLVRQSPVQRWGRCSAEER